MRRIKIGLLPRIVLAIVLGVALGACAPGAFVRGVNTMTAVIDQFIRFMVPLIILGLVPPAIADVGRGAGKLLLATVALAYASTLFAGFLGYTVAVTAFPSLVGAGGMAFDETARAFPPFATVKIPAMFDVMSSLVFAFMAGLGLAATGADVLRRAAAEFRALVTKVISAALVPILPLFVFGIFLDMTATGKAGAVLAAFAAVIAVICALTLAVILIQYGLAGAFARKNPLKAIAGMLPAYMTALGTASSAATIPVTRACVVANGVRPETADFVVPLCATVHLAGSAVKIVACSVAVVLASGAPVDAGRFAGFILIFGLVMVAAPGVPGGAIMASVGVLESMMGFNAQQIALLISVYLAIDSVGTACNVVGDGAIALVIDRFAAGRSRASGA